ncbi:MAG: membrane protein insertase YidC [Acidobacteria bacterium]|nr:membrane protein insertase YidC [Acidobacteriota bacterium]
MPESVNSGGSPQQPKKELSTELRLLIAFALMGLVMFTMPYFYKSIAPQQLPKKNPVTAVTPAKPEAAPAQAAPAAPPAPIPSAPVAAQKEEFYTIDTNLYHITCSNRGGVVSSWLLKSYKTHDRKPLELVNTAAKTPRPFSFYFQNQKLPVDLNQVLYAAKPDPDGLGITFEYSDGHVFARKTFRFKKNSYLSQVSSQVTDNGKYIPAYLEWRGGDGDLAVANPSGAQQALYFNSADNKLVKHGAKDAKDGPVSSSGPYSFAGLEDTYFAAAFLPEADAANVHTVVFSDQTRTVLEAKEEPFAGAAVSDGGANRFALFVGPKDVDLLKSINPKLEQLVDFGWFSFLAKPLFLVATWTERATASATEVRLKNHCCAIITRLLVK